MIESLLTLPLPGRVVRCVNFSMISPPGRTVFSRGQGESSIEFDDGWILTVPSPGLQEEAVGVSSGLRDCGERVRELRADGDTLEVLMVSGESLLLTVRQYAGEHEWRFRPATPVRRKRLLPATVTR